MKLRVKFTKNGRIKFIGHLDVMRYFQKAMRRADIDIAYSKGYSPHQIMSFAAPLSVGLTSDGEYFDMEAVSVTTEKDMLDHLNAVMADGITVTEIRILPDTCKNAMASVAAAGYTVRFREGYEPDFEYRTAFEQFCSQAEIPYLKITQKNETELNLKDYLFDYRVNQDGSIYLLVDASSSGNLKPVTILGTFYQQLGHTLGEFDLIVHREDTFLRLEDGSFAPLTAIGTAF